MTYLDEIRPLRCAVGWGELGLGGALGYEGKHVVVGGRRYEHALSAHPPARLLYILPPGRESLRASVALNDDVPAGAAEADFSVLADGRLAASAVRVRAGDPPRTIEARVSGARTLELVVSTGRWPMCHAVWLDPALEGGPGNGTTTTLSDPLERLDITLPSHAGPYERCLATVVSAGYAHLVDDLLGSFLADGGCPDTGLVVFMLGEDAECERVIAKYGALAVRCRSRGRRDVAAKAALYSVALVIEARSYLCVDADMLVHGDLRPLFATLEAVPDTAILACSEQGNPAGDVRSAIKDIYGGRPGDLASILGPGAGEIPPTPILNDGMFAGSRAALAALDTQIRAMPGAAAWVRAGVPWRNQYIFNLAVARLGALVQLDGVFNVQLHATDVEVADTPLGPRATWQGRPVRLLHANGAGRDKRPELRGTYARVAEPLLGSPGGELYDRFVDTLRAWIGRHGVGALAWSFYGTTDARGGRVRDPSAFPLLAALHYLVRANGCIRVLETGTAKGVSAACLASAVAHRAGGSVVTIDVADDPLRADLWARLPAGVRRCIDERRAECVGEMQRMLEAGEQFQAALLDTDHSAEQVWAEFDVARELVCQGGLVLVHDPGWGPGTVEQGLERIAAEGYGVVPLWLADDGIAEDDHLGLAVVENRRRSSAR